MAGSSNPDIRLPSEYPLDWLIKKFPSKSRVQSLLGPERDNGNISLHDYVLAESFLPGWHRWYPLIWGTPFMLMADVVVLRKYRHWPFWRRMVVGTSAGLPFMLVGTVHRGLKHEQFSIALENPTGFARALENVNTRLGGKSPLNATFATLSNGQLGLVNARGPIGLSSQTGRQSEDKIDTDWQPAIDTTAQDANSPIPLSKELRKPSSWDQIRKDSPTTTESSWDKVRQNDEHRPPPPNNNRNKQEQRPPKPSMDEERAAEQAKFDAMLESERNIGKEGERSGSVLDVSYNHIMPATYNMHPALDLFNNVTSYVIALFRVHPWNGRTMPEDSVAELRKHANYPLRWLMRTFPSKRSVQELLGPERDNGTVSQHDYLLAESFLPGTHRYLPYIWAIPAAFVADWALSRRFRHWSPVRRFFIGTAAGIPFFFVGLGQRSMQHFKFSISLENPQGFANALENVNTKLGATEPLNPMIATRKNGNIALLDPRDGHLVELRNRRGGPLPHEAKPTIGANSEEMTFGELASTGDGAAEPPMEHPRKASDAVQDTSSWEQIRKERTNTTESSWDKLRQHKERASLPAGNRQDGLPQELSADEERRIEQAKFDAMLDAERNIGSQAERKVDGSI